MEAGEEVRITAFELWSWRAVLRIIWMGYKTNVWVRQKIVDEEDDELGPPVRVLAGVDDNLEESHMHHRHRGRGRQLSPILGRSQRVLLQFRRRQNIML